MQKIHLISIWPLKDDCPDELTEILMGMPAAIIANEPGTLSYAININSANPLDSKCKSLQKSEIIFIETYQDISAFDVHINGPLFTVFRTQNLKYFKEDPDKPGWPITQNTYLGTLASAGKWLD